MFTPYRTILRLPGTLRFSCAGLVARLPIAMVSLGLVLLVSAKTGSYALAGSVSACYVLATALVAPLQARLTDREGQRRVLPWLAVGYAVSLGLVIVVVETGLPTPLPHLGAALAGATAPLIGSYVRARWSHLLSGKPELQTAFGLESTIDETLFMVGPPVVTYLATDIHPAAGLLTALVCGVTGTLLLGAQGATQPPAHRLSRTAGTHQPLGRRALLPLVVAGAGFGALFGSTDVAVVALATEQHARSLSGILLASGAMGAMFSALYLGTRHFTTSPLIRLRIGAAALALSQLPRPFIDHLGWIGVSLFVSGLAVSLSLMSNVALVERTVPASRLSEGFAWMGSGLIGGLALGAAVVGPVIDRFGPSVGFWVPIAAALVSVGAAVVAKAGVRPSIVVDEPEPPHPTDHKT